METIFPTTTGYEGFFLIGFRKDLNHPMVTQRTGTAILKRTYDIDPTTGTLTPSPEPLPVFMQDAADNLVLNSDFETDPLDGDWTAEGGAAIAQATDVNDADFNYMQVTGSANGRVVQTLTFDEPLGGRVFTFSFSASADANAQINNARLEAEGESGTVVICDIDQSLNTVMARHFAVGTWPANLEATEMRVVLRMATSSLRTVYYDNVQVEERGYLTVWDPATTLRYEHDLATFKPRGDVIVLGFAGNQGITRLRVNNAVWMTRNVASVSPRVKALFGWEPRNVDPRLGEAGTFPEDGDAYPLPDTLPSDFDNRFYHGCRRTNATDQITESLPVSSYLPGNAAISIDLPVTPDYTFNLNGEVVSARYFYFSGIGDDDENHWQSVPFTMKLDTLVIEPEENRSYVVWRGVWPYDQQPEDSYRRLVVEAS